MDKYQLTKLNNKGVSLVELLIVIAIMGILVGGSALGISLVFSKDATQCATRLNDVLTTARMYSMSKVGDYSLVITTDDGSADGKYVADIYNGDTSVEANRIDRIYLEEQSGGKKISSITPEFIMSGTAPTVSIPELIIKFDKSKGCVTEIGSESFDDKNAILKFTIEASRGTDSHKKAEVNLVTTTGKHTIGDF